ncbi:MAG: hypothetical protein ABEH59_02940 [Halobacteriales archaeon]
MSEGLTTDDLKRIEEFCKIPRHRRRADMLGSARLTDETTDPTDPDAP